MEEPTKECDADPLKTPLGCAQVAISAELLDGLASVLTGSDDFTEAQQSATLADGGIDALIKKWTKDDTISQLGDET